LTESVGDEECRISKTTDNSIAQYSIVSVMTSDLVHLAFR